MNQRKDWCILTWRAHTTVVVRSPRPRSSPGAFMDKTDCPRHRRLRQLGQLVKSCKVYWLEKKYYAFPHIDISWRRENRCVEVRKQHKMSWVLNSPVLVCWNRRFERIVGRCWQKSVLCLGDWNKVCCQYISSLNCRCTKHKVLVRGAKKTDEQRFIDSASIVSWLRY